MDEKMSYNLLFVW